MPRVIGDTTRASNVIDAYTFTDKVRYVDLSGDLPDDVTLESVALVEQTNDGDPAAEDLTLSAINVVSSPVTVSDGRTIASGKGFSFRATGGEPATYEITFSYEDSLGNTDGKTVSLRVR